LVSRILPKISTAGKPIRCSAKSLIQVPETRLIFIAAHKETLSVVAAGVGNPDCAAFSIER